MRKDELSEAEFRKRYPHRAREMEARDGLGMSVGGRLDASRGFQPDIIDFLRRCDREASALEIIGYLENRGEISHAYAERLRAQLRERGLRSFGERRSDGHYFKEFGGPSP